MLSFLNSFNRSEKYNTNFWERNSSSDLTQLSILCARIMNYSRKGFFFNWSNWLFFVCLTFYFTVLEIQVRVTTSPLFLSTLWHLPWLFTPFKCRAFITIIAYTHAHEHVHIHGRTHARGHTHNLFILSSVTPMYIDMYVCVHIYVFMAIYRHLWLST